MCESSKLISMDVLVEWDDHTKNVVNTKELECDEASKEFKRGQKIRMYWGSKYYYGKILRTEEDSFSETSESDDDIPLSVVIKQRKKCNEGDAIEKRNKEQTNIENDDISHKTLDVEAGDNYESITSSVVKGIKDNEEKAVKL
ncbi:hypothetical protein Pcinc_001206 [Petrolisthes cinctipes]|uniref:Uncharacterized protein n=1 Tax=Petrolisthes cinctipes TaxID=88211 RepID=A0AAE1GRH3_PETCI|nr:hypothetical protein Pcinc_001206 [Petrolisthes cinctipes]